MLVQNTLVQGQHEFFKKKPEYTLTPKQIVEYCYLFRQQLSDKFYTYRKLHLDIKDYDDICRYKLNKYTYNVINLTLLTYPLNFNCSLYFYTNDCYVQCLLDLNTHTNFFSILVSPTIEVDVHFYYKDDVDNYLGASIYLYKSKETYNGNDVFYIASIEPTSDASSSEIEKLVTNSRYALYGDNIVLICPHDSYENFIAAYPDGNGSYTTTRPANIDISITINYVRIPENDWLSLRFRDEEVQSKIDSVYSTLIQEWKSWINGTMDFSPLSSTDNVKIDVSKEVYDVLKNPWKYFNELDIFNGHEYVDLGLPSGTLWATMNVGAWSETDYGNYYQYGKGADQYEATSGDSDYSGTEDPLDSSVDTVAQVWGGSWHMPTRAQMEELTDNTTYQWVTDYKGSGINGGTFTATNGAVLFFPAAGYWDDGSQSSVGDYGDYWGSSPNGSDDACSLYFSGGGKGVYDNGRGGGFSVRGVIEQN